MIRDRIFKTKIINGNKVRFYFDPCSGCNQERWCKVGAIGKKCQYCTQFKRGWRMHPDGYRLIYVRYHPNIYKGKRPGYMMEHRLIVEKAIGRYLDHNEVIHHINHNKLDNRIENLIILMGHADHTKVHNEYDKKAANKFLKPSMVY